MDGDGRREAQVIPLVRRAPSLPAEVQAVMALLQAVSDPQLRRYCLDQIGTADGADEVADALALTRALGEGHARAAAALGTAVVGLASVEAAGIGQDLSAAGSAVLRPARKRKVRCIATSSSP